MLFKNENGKLVGDSEISALLKEGQIFITENDYKDCISIEEGIGRMDGNTGKYEVQRCSFVGAEASEDIDEIACEFGYQILDEKLYNVEEIFEPVSDEEVEKILHKYLKNKCSFDVEKTELVEMLKNQIREMFLFNDFDIEVKYEEENEDEYNVELEFYIDYKRIALAFEFSKSEWFGYSYENVMSV